MKIRIENFGPIRKATIATKPLTLIIGKNNQGKSYSAELIFAILQLKRFLAEPSFAVGTRNNSIIISLPSRDIRRLNRVHIGKREYAVTIKQSDLDRYTDHELAAQIVDRVVSILTSLTENQLPPLLEERFGMGVGALVNICMPTANIRFDLSKYISMSAEISKKGKIKVKAHLKKENSDKLKAEFVSSVKKMRQEFLPILESIEQHFPKAVFDAFSFLLEKLTGNERKRGRARPTTEIIYIPAGRAGLLEGYQSVHAALFGLSPIAVQRGISMPPMPPTAAAFYNMMLSFRGRRGKFGEIASELAKDVLEGEIAMEQDRKQQGPPKISYKFSKDKYSGSVDIIHAGSMIKELIGLYLAIKEKLKSNTYLIVEEPESHLHPSAQKKLAGILMKLAANGVEMLITTHSDIILREIAHLIGKRQATKSRDSLPSNKVSAILLKKGEKGSFSQELAIPPSGILEGIPTFDEVIMELYEDEISLESQST